jgi:hypothetical protein
MRRPIPQPLPMHQTPRCGARTRQGTSCRQPAVTGKVRCRMHGGTDGIGAPCGNQNAWKHGRYTAEAIAQRREVAALIRACQDPVMVAGGSAADHGRFGRKPQGLRAPPDPGHLHRRLIGAPPLLTRHDRGRDRTRRRRRAVPVTTVKDAVRLPAEARAMMRAVPVAVTWNDPAALARLLAPIVNRYGNA